MTNFFIYFAEAGVAENQGWCATKVDTHDDYIPHNWGICQPECKPPVSKCIKEFYCFRLKVCILWRFKISDYAILLWKLKISRFAHKLQNSSTLPPKLFWYLNVPWRSRPVTPMMMPRLCPSSSRNLRYFFKSHIFFLIMAKWPKIPQKHVIFPLGTIQVLRHQRGGWVGS